MTTTTARRQFAKRERPQQGTVLQQRLDAETFAAIGSVLDAVRPVCPGVGALEQVRHFTDATSVLETACGAVQDLAEAEPSAEHLALLRRVTGLERQIRQAEAAYKDEALQSVKRALARLQDVTSVHRLLDAGTEAICSFGFDRAIISRVDQDMWVTESLHIDGDAEWALEVLEAGRNNPQPLAAGLPEYEVVRRRRPILVTQVQDRSDVHQALAASSQSRSYVAAPLMPSSKVIGFLHGDRFFHSDDVTDFDSELLHLFAEGFGYALERALLLERLDQLRSDLLGGAMADPTVTPLSYRRPSADAPRVAPVPPRTVASAPTEPDDDARLTRREMDVLRLLAGGDTNTRIAHRLVISESTVKTHVKSILRKLGASNRAEAVARWHGATRP